MVRSPRPSNGQTRPSLDRNILLRYGLSTVITQRDSSDPRPPTSDANAARDPSRSERSILPRNPTPGRSLKQCSCRNRLRAARCTPDVPRQHVMRAESPVALSIWPRAQLLFRGHLGRRLLLRSVHPWTDTCKLARTSVSSPPRLWVVSRITQLPVTKRRLFLARAITTAPSFLCLGARGPASRYCVLVVGV